MSFSISVSGINAAQKHLDVTSNNIANVNTIGFKSSRAEFADVYSTSIFTDTRTTVGNGVQTAAVSQQFYQGSLDTTQNALDLAIKGDGFFVLSPSSTSLERTYTRAGAFQCDEDGYVTNSQGQYLQVYDVQQDGSVKSLSLDSTKPLKIPSSAGSPTETDKVNADMTLPANADPLSVSKFDPKDNSTFSASTSVKIYDSLGDSHTATYYFVRDDRSGTEVKDADGNSIEIAGTDPKQYQKYPVNMWQMFLFVDDQPVNVDGGSQQTISEISSLGEELKKAGKNGLTSTTIVFDQNGNLDENATIWGNYKNNDDTYSIQPKTTITGTYPQKTVTEELGVDALGNNLLKNSGANVNQQIEFNFGNNLHMYGGTSFSVNALTQNGSTVGQLTNVEIDDAGLVSATYSNGSNVKLGMVSIATFPNQQGLTQIGDTCWRASLDSGVAVPAQAGLGTAGSIQSSALEQSNTDLSAQLVELISAQRNYQANARALDVSNTVMDSILNIR